MSSKKAWTINDPDLPEDLHLIREIMSQPPKPKVLNTRKEKEGLHDYFMRKGLKCFCPDCRIKEKKQKA